MSFLQYIEERTNQYINEFPKAERKKIGQFFTAAPVASYMGNLASCRRDALAVLDAGAGAGILSAAVLERVVQFQEIRTVHLTLYEDNCEIVPLLRSNISFLKNKLDVEYQVDLHVEIINDNFILANEPIWNGETDESTYDIVISNPPYKKISKNAKESLAMSDVVFGQPNLYFLFMAMSAKLLKENGEFIFIIPRSFSSGLYFLAFRKWFFSRMDVMNVHLFVSRDKVFSEDKVLQETVILKAVKRKTANKPIIITECESVEDFGDLESFSVPYRTCFPNGESFFMFLPTQIEDLDAIDFVNQWGGTFRKEGFQVKTGTVVDFRAKAWLRLKGEIGCVPLLWAQHFKGNKIVFPLDSEGKPQYLTDCEETKRLQMKVSNYLILKRFTSKEERRRLQCALLLEEDFKQFPAVSTENHLNFIIKINGDLTLQELYGIFVVLNSTIVDRYFRMLNGSTQVNANEINSMPFPFNGQIRELGEEALKLKRLDEQACDDLLVKTHIANEIKEVI